MRGSLFGGEGVCGWVSLWRCSQQLVSSECTHAELCKEAKVYSMERRSNRESKAEEQTLNGVIEKDSRVPNTKLIYRCKSHASGP